MSVHPADVRDDAAIGELVDAAVREHGRLDVVVHAAGVVAYGNFLDVPAEVFDAVQDTNLRGSATVARAVLPVFRRQRHGHLVLLGSILGDVAVPGMTSYVISKHAVAALGRRINSGVLNGVIRLGFRLMPRLFDRLVGPLFGLLATRPGTVEASSGNLFAPVEENEATRGGENQGLCDLIGRLGGR